MSSLIRGAAARNRAVGQGRIRSILGITIEVEGLRTAIGDLCTIQTAAGNLSAEVVGFRDGVSLVMPLAVADGIAPNDLVTGASCPLVVPTGDALLGRVLDALGQPLDDRPPPGGPPRVVSSSAPSALTRQRVTEVFQTGVSAIDGFATCGRGQRIGIFSGSGVGKSTLLGQIARGAASDVNVIALIGERGREVRDFIEEVLGPDGLARSVLVVATSDAPPMQRLKGPFTAVTIAEAFREQGRNVLFMMDSVTRFAGASREVGLAVGEPPTLRGYPPSLFAQLPRLVERLGNDDRGSITGMLTVLVEGDDLNEPVSDALRGHLDGHIVLSRALADRGRFPAIDVLASLSRLMVRVASPDHAAAARELRGILALYEENRDLVQIGAYSKGTDPRLDRAIERMPEIEGLLYHNVETRPFEETVTRLATLASDSILAHGMVDR